MVQIAVKKPIIVAQPIGHSVPFSNWVQTSCVLFVFGELIDPTGNQITNIRMMTQLQMVPTLLTPAFQSEPSIRTLHLGSPPSLGI